MRNHFFDGCHNSEMSAVSSKDLCRRYVTVPAYQQNFEAHYMLCVPSPPMYAFHTSPFGEKALRFGQLLPETAMTGFFLMSLVCFVQAAEFGVAKLIVLARL